MQRCTGYVEVARMATMIRAAGETPTEAKLSEVIRSATDSDGCRVTVDHFIQVVADLRYDKDTCRPSASDVEAAFRVFDRSGRGFLTKDEIARVLTSFGDKLSADEVERLLAVADVDEQGRIDYKRFATKLVS